MVPPDKTESISAVQTERVGRVPSENYVPDAMWEEERIMAERSAPPHTMGSYDLRVPVRDLALGPPVTVSPNTTIRAAIAHMQDGSFGCVLVVDPENGTLAGIFTERDLLVKIAGKKLDWDVQLVRDFMTPDPETLCEGANLAFVLNRMTSGGFRHVPIVDADRKPLCVVSVRDVMRYICSFFEKEVENLPPRPEILHPEVRESM
jgi:CBS domain-containing protein